jgi:hypothetical protein
LVDEVEADEQWFGEAWIDVYDRQGQDWGQCESAFVHSGEIEERYRASIAAW